MFVSCSPQGDVYGQPGGPMSKELGKRSSEEGGRKPMEGYGVFCRESFVTCKLRGLLCTSCSDNMISGADCITPGAGGELIDRLLRLSYSSIKLPISILYTSPRAGSVSTISLELLARTVAKRFDRLTGLLHTAACCPDNPSAESHRGRRRIEQTGCPSSDFRSCHDPDLSTCSQTP